MMPEDNNKAHKEHAQQAGAGQGRPDRAGAGWDGLGRARAAGAVRGGQGGPGSRGEPDK